jgi:hypothetical protein
MTDANGETCNQNQSKNQVIHNIKTVSRNCDSKMLSVGTILAYLETTAWIILFFRNKTFMFFKIESCNYQQLCENKFHETSQNFNSFRQPIEKLEIKIV